MSVAIALDGPRIDWFSDYKPASHGSQDQQQRLNRGYNFLIGSAMDWYPSITASLKEIARDCAEDNWDGENASAISNKVISVTGSVAWALFAILPKGTPYPEMIPEGDGEISLSWSLNDGRIFSISIGAHGKANFAGQLGQKGAVHAWQPIDASNPHALEESLEGIAKYIAQLFSPKTR